MWQHISSLCTDTACKTDKSQDLQFISSADASAVSPAQMACNAVALQHTLRTTHSISSFGGLVKYLNSTLSWPYITSSCWLQHFTFQLLHPLETISSGKLNSIKSSIKNSMSFSLIPHMCQLELELAERGMEPFTGFVNGASGRRRKQVGFVVTNGWMR